MGAEQREIYAISVHSRAELTVVTGENTGVSADHGCLWKTGGILRVSGDAVFSSHEKHGCVRNVPSRMATILQPEAWAIRFRE
ncbi:hypothetical protein AGR2A_Lc60167 [Agrobacterium genomosp. 2 str. CFBP 5494]|uniref:Uncharacterized protein n=1 Tax=Agrobacterium genomosp. 2 str. CFBP 5494 TaxID=1183436 RepID=A0A9W5B526_9HYPH|nr:hypothetical protein AGR2A_Lc60167 [Agrobacterium genomosp. 2 str. CFBP 5494]